MYGIQVQMPHCWLFERDKGCGHKCNLSHDVQSLQAPPPGSKSCTNFSLRTQCAAVASADAHFATVFHRRLRRARKKRRKQDQHLREMIVPPNQVKMSNAEIDSKVLVVDGGGVSPPIRPPHGIRWCSIPVSPLLEIATAASLAPWR